ncbi:MAG TPA: autotransporter-associated beta strand repeat-containing protein [Tepidisphaeraceae bacterium]|nr:autotransporter-associated beta strand repeat-containing protein [Tepidisphaeraceae bacterium]
MAVERRAISSGSFNSFSIFAIQSNRRKCLRLLSAAVCATSGLLLAGGMAHGQTNGTDTWTSASGDGTGNFSSAANWTGQNTPPISGDTLSFGSTSGVTSLNDDLTSSTFVVDGLSFTSGAAGYTILGNSLDFAAGLTNSATGVAEVIGDAINLAASQTFSLAPTSVITLMGVVSGSNSNTLTINGGGSIVFGAANTYAGPVVLDGANVTYLSNVSASTLTFGATASSANVSTVNLNGGMTVSDLQVLTSSGSANTINIAANQSLTINGPLTVGHLLGSKTFTSTLTVSGAGGTLAVNGTVTSGLADGSGQADTLVNLSALGNFTQNAPTGYLNIGAQQECGGTFSLAATNQINVSGVTVGGMGTNVNGEINTLILGSGNTVITAGSITIGSGKAGGIVQFPAGDSTASLTVVGSPTLNIEFENGSNTGVGPSQLLLAGNNVNINAGLVNCGAEDGVSNVSGYGGQAAQCGAIVTFDTGTFTAASGMVISADSAGASSAPISSSFTLGSNAQSTGVLTVSSQFDLGDNTNSLHNTVTTATFTINGGTADINCPIVAVNNNTMGSIDPTLNLFGGTLNMNGNSIGGTAADNAHTATSCQISVSLVPSSGQTATIESLGGAGINGSGLNANGAGTLILAANNTYSGGTTIAAGSTLQIGAGAIAGNLPAAGAVMNNGTLNFAGNGEGTVSGVVSGSGVVNQLGGGVTDLAGINNYSGNTTVSAGTLAVEGQLYNGVSSPGTVSVVAGTLAGSGTINSGVSLSGGTIMPDVAATPLTMSSLSMTSGTLQFNINGSLAGQISVSGSASLSGGAIAFGLDSAPTQSSYTLLTSSSLSNSLLLSPELIGRVQLTPEEEGNNIVVNVGGGPANLIWIGNANSGTWDVQTTQNWNDPTYHINPDVFYAADNVTFNDTAANFTVNLNGQVSPSSVTFANNSNNYSITGTGGIAGSTGLTLNGAAAVTIATSNSFTGDTDVNAGSLTITSGGAIASGNVNVASGAALTVAGGGSLTAMPNLDSSGTVNFNNPSPSVGALNGSGGTINLNSNTLTVSGGGAYGGTIADGGTSSGLTVAGGTLVLSAANTYGGATTVDAGAELTIASTGSISSSTNVIANGEIDLLEPSPAIASLNGSGVVNLGGSNSMTVSNGGAFSGSIEGAGSGVTYAGGSILLTGNSTYTGTTTLEPGVTVTIGNSASNALGAVGGGGSVSVEAGATLNLGNNNLNGIGFGGLTFDIAGAGVGGVGAIVNGGNGQDGPFEHIALTGNATIADNGIGQNGLIGINDPTGTSINLNGFTLTKTGTGTLVLNGAGNVAGPGAITIAAGTFNIEGAASIPNTVNVNYLDGTIMEFASATGALDEQSVIGDGVTTTNGVQLVDGATSNITIGGNILLQDTLTVLNLSSTGGAVQVNGNITDNGLGYGLVKNNIGGTDTTLTLAGNSNTYTGPTMLISGAISVGDGGADGSLGTGPVTDDDTLIFNSARTDLVISANISGGGNVNQVGTGVTTLSGSNSYTGGTNLDAGTLAITSDAAINYGGINFNGGTLQFDNYTSTLSFNANLSLGAAAGSPATLAGTIYGSSLTYVGPGTLILSGSNGYNGSTNINAGTLAITSDAGIGNGQGGINFNGGTLQFNNYTSTLALSGSNVSIGAATGSASTLAGGITDGGSSTNVTYAGPGTLVLSGANTYSGSTNVNAGELRIASASALPPTTTLTIGTATSTAAAQLAAIGSLFTLAGLTVNAGSTLDVASNRLIINYGSTDPIAAIQSYLSDGHAGGWAGGEITSSTVAALNRSQTHLIYDVGYADGADGMTSLSSGEIEIVPTVAGDAKLQGNVVFGDFQVLAQYFGKAGGWDQGNFAYAATIDFGDFQMLAQDFGANSSGLTSGESASLQSFAAQFGDELQPNADGVGFTIVSVPEPASIGLMAAVGLGMLSRRQRKLQKC